MPAAGPAQVGRSCENWPNAPTRAYAECGPAGGSGSVDDAGAHRDGDDLGAVAGTEFAADPGEVTLDGQRR